MRFQTVRPHLVKLLLFDRATLALFEKNKHALDLNIKYWLKSGELIALKRGLYVLRERFEREQDKEQYLAYCANQLVKPSYLSAEYVMAKYNLLTEAVYVVTSITTKKPTTFTNPLGTFRYYSISPRLFTGYRRMNFRGAPVYGTGKSKAVFDYLYLRFLKAMPVNETSIEELRINWGELSRAEFAEVKSFLALTPSRRVRDALGIIGSKYYARTRAQRTR